MSGTSSWSAGGLIDLEFIAQVAVLTGQASAGDAHARHRRRAGASAPRLRRRRRSRAGTGRGACALLALTQMIRLCLTGPFDREDVPPGLADLLLRGDRSAGPRRAGGAPQGDGADGAKHFDRLLRAEPNVTTAAIAEPFQMHRGSRMQRRRTMKQVDQTQMHVDRRWPCRCDGRLAADGERPGVDEVDRAAALRFETAPTADDSGDVRSSRSSAPAMNDRLGHGRRRIGDGKMTVGRDRRSDDREDALPSAWPERHRRALRRADGDGALTMRRDRVAAEEDVRACSTATTTARSSRTRCRAKRRRPRR